MQQRSTRVAVAVSLSFLIALESATVTSSAFADEGDRARAEQLFLDAKQLMDQGKYAEACPKLEASQRLDPADGTLLRYAWCEEELGNLATSWVLFRDGLARAKKSNNAARIKFAEDHLAAIEPKLSKVIIHVSPPADINGLELRWDGKVLGRGEWNSEFPVDAGTHMLSASATGRQTWTTSIGVGASGDRRTVEIPQLLESTPVEAPTDSGSRRTIALVLGGAGVLFIGGLWARSWPRARPTIGGSPIACRSSPLRATTRGSLPFAHGRRSRSYPRGSRLRASEPRFICMHRRRAAPRSRLRRLSCALLRWRQVFRLMERFDHAPVSTRDLSPCFRVCVRRLPNT